MGFTGVTARVEKGEILVEATKETTIVNTIVTTADQINQRIAEIDAEKVELQVLLDAIVAKAAEVGLPSPPILATP